MSSQARAESPYLINFGDDLWDVELLTETCPYRLKMAVEEVLETLSSRDREIVALLPEKLGYQFFKVEFKELKNERILDLETPTAYQFQYWTQYDEHKRCLKVEMYNRVK